MSHMSDLAVQQANDCDWCWCGWRLFCPSEPDKCSGCEVEPCPYCQRGAMNVGLPVPQVSEAYAGMDEIEAATDEIERKTSDDQLS